MLHLASEDGVLDVEPCHGTLCIHVCMCWPKAANARTSHLVKEGCSLGEVPQCILRLTKHLCITACVPVCAFTPSLEYLERMADLHAQRHGIGMALQLHIGLCKCVYV